MATENDSLLWRLQNLLRHASSRSVLLQYFYPVLFVTAPIFGWRLWCGVDL